MNGRQRDGDKKVERAPDVENPHQRSRSFPIAQTRKMDANGSSAAIKSPNAAGQANFRDKPGYVAPRVRNINPRCRNE